jgi:hypothetical protein
MNTRFKNGLIVAVVAGFSLAGVGQAMPQSYLDGSAKMRGDYGQMSRSQSSPMYRYTAPSQQRSFSYEPAQQAPSAAQPAPTNGGCGCGTADSGKTAASNQPAAGQGSVAQRSTQTNRSFSYEPGTTSSNGAMRNRSSSTPLWALPKSDPRKSGGR